MICEFVLHEETCCGLRSDDIRGLERRPHVRRRSHAVTARKRRSFTAGLERQTECFRGGQMLESRAQRCASPLRVQKIEAVRPPGSDFLLVYSVK